MSDSFGTPWTVAHQAPLSMGFLRQEYWSGLPFPSLGIFPTQWSKPRLLPASEFFTIGPQGKRKRSTRTLVFTVLVPFNWTSFWLNNREGRGKGRGKRKSLPMLYDCWASNVNFSKIILFDSWQLTLGKSNLIHYFILLKWILSARLVEVNILIGDIIIFELKKEEKIDYTMKILLGG